MTGLLRMLAIAATPWITGRACGSSLPSATPIRGARTVSLSHCHGFHVTSALRASTRPPRAARVAVAATGIERHWSDDEIIVSKTDLAGRITYANDVFHRVSGYSPAELLGAPHSIIRHPDMPRAIFALLWAQLEAEREVFAYVKNLTPTGDHYWVFAHITPTRGPGGRISGYHSNRRTVDRRALVPIEALYAELRAAEAGHARKRDAIAASTALLDRRLAERGMSYDEYVWRV